MSTYVSHTQNRLTGPPPARPRDRRARNAFWIDDRIVDDFAPVMARYSAGVAALSVYIALARHADRQGESWPSLTTIATEVGVSSRTVQRAIRLLEVLGLIDVTSCYEEGSHRQTSNLYTLLTLPPQLPGIDPDERRWPPPRRRTLCIQRGPRGGAIPTARGTSEDVQVVAPAGTLDGPRLVPVGRSDEVAPLIVHPCQPDTLPHDTASSSPCSSDTLPPCQRVTPSRKHTRRKHNKGRTC
jgi:hypothetical protein